MQALEELLLLSRRGLLGAAAVLLLPRRAQADQTAAILEAAAARILPSDDGPGAREAKVGRFLERQLAGDLAELQPAFAQLARLIDLWAQKSSGMAFVALPAEAQDRILAQLAGGQIPARGLPQEVLFRALHGLVLEGFLSDPVHGGNDGMIGWHSIGFATPHLRRPGLPHGHR
jgi:gluconate 2-dehydrogenase gamma chain